MEERYPNALPPGTRVGAVVMERAIGQGAWGIVYEGQHDKYGRVAIKEYFPSTYASRETRGSVSSNAPQWQDAVRRGLERFGNEARALRTIRHENVVAVYDYIEDGDTALLVTEFIDGRPLSALLADGQFSDPAEIAKLADTLVGTLQALATKNIVHRDIAPDNIMIREDGSPVLVDFGGAAAAVASATRSTQNITKDGYSPPEQYDTSANPTFPVGAWSDIYATAAVIYRLAAAREPAVANARLLAAGMKNAPDPLVPLAEIAPAGFAKHWCAAVDAALALLPRDRPQTASQWRSLFEAPAPVVKPQSNRMLVGITAASVTIALAAVATIAAPKLLGSHDAAIASATPAALVQHVTPRRTRPKPRHPVIARASAPSHSDLSAASQNARMQQPQYVMVQPVQQQPVQQQPVAPPPVQPQSVQRQSVPARSAARQAPPHVLASKPAKTLVANDGNANGRAIPTLAPTTTTTPTPAPTAVPTATPVPAPTASPLATATAIAAVPAGTCRVPYVWRASSPSDMVCVPVASRTLVQAENAAADQHRNPAGAYGPNSCAAGYVWRTIVPTDLVCVTPAQRTEALTENRLGPARTLNAAP